MKSNMVKRLPTHEKRGKSNSSKVTLHRGVGLPPKFGTTLRASTAWNLNHAGTIQRFGVTCNDPYRPFATFTTAEIPAYLTYLSQAYDQVYVIRSRVHVELINSTVADSIAMTLGFDSDTAGTPAYNDIAESRDAQSRMVGYYTAGNNMTTFNSEYTSREYQGIPADSPDNICKAGVAPPNPYYWIAGLQSVAGGTGNVGARVIVEYDVVFAELKLPSP
jgi:hypothetical protein